MILVLIVSRFSLIEHISPRAKISHFGTGSSKSGSKTELAVFAEHFDIAAAYRCGRVVLQ
jgi:hypothetical protein